MAIFLSYPVPLSVALLTESVDWNINLRTNLMPTDTSLSSRRAWIEITVPTIFVIPFSPSLSSRRAWIEIKVCNKRWWLYCVALLTESVDWNKNSYCKISWIYSRSPHGERGLKFFCKPQLCKNSMSLSSRRAWIEITALALTMFLVTCRSPHGERGLKYFSTLLFLKINLSLSSRRAWIEIQEVRKYHQLH